jgi:two-component system, OmpR family, response regulator
VNEALRVLVVDDDESQLALLSRVLRGRGVEVSVSASSIGVTNMIRRLLPDVVLLDVHIPALSGDALVTIARRSAPAQTRFVLYSSCDESELRSLARKVGADGYVSKSVDPFLLPDILRDVMRSSRPPGPPG